MLPIKECPCKHGYSYYNIRGAKNNMASFRKRGSKWSVRISFYENKKRNYIEKSGFKTKSEAQKYAAEQERLLNKGIKINRPNIPFVEYFHDWYETYKANKVTQITLNRYKVTETALRTFFKDALIKSINRTDYQKFINWYGANHAPHSVNRTNSLIRNCVKSAILDDYIQKDFTAGITMVSNKDKMIDVEYLSVDEIKTLLNETMSKLDTRYTSRYMIVTAILTGMRIGEISALTWNDIDFKNQTININKSWDVRSGIKPTKTKSSVRTIAVSKELLDILSQLKINNTKEVFKCNLGTIPTGTAVNKTLRAILKKCGLEKKNFHFHSLRHAHVAYLLYQNIDIYVISKRLGHENITTTLNIYAYLMDEHSEKENEVIRQKISELFNGGQNVGKMP